MKKSFFSKNSNLIFVTLMLVIGIGYALISTSLGITGLGNFRANTWNIYFANIIDGSVNVDNSSIEISADKKSVEFEVNLNKPGQSYIFYTDVVNEGTIDAMLDTLEIQGISDEIKDFISAEVTYLDGIAVSKYDKLTAGTSDVLKINVSYRTDIEADDLPDVDGALDLTLTVDYIQADENAVEREHGTIDPTAPTIDFEDESSNDWTNVSSVSFEIVDIDPIRSVKYCVSSDTCTPDTEAELVNNVFTYNFTSSNEAKKICIAATDIYGNTNTTCSENSYLVDLDAPELTSFEATGDSDNATISVSVTAADNLSGVATYYYSKDGGTTYTSSINSNYTFTSLDAGDYTIVAYAEDEAGNTSETSTSTVEIKSYDIYVALYSDGTLTFNNKEVINEEKTLVENFGNIKNRYYYTSSSDVPWYSYKDSITLVDIESKIFPKRMAYWFYEHSNLTRVLHGENINTSEVTSMSDMFSYDNNLTEINVSTWDTSNVTSMARMFLSTSSLLSLNVSNWKTGKVTDMRMIFAYNSSLTTLDISKWDVSKVRDMAGFFSGLSNLDEINVSNWVTSSVTDMGSMFSGISLTTVDVSNFDVSKVTNMYGMFQGSSNLVGVDVSDWNVSNVESMYSMFAYDYALETVDVSNWVTSSLREISGMFDRCTSLTNLDVSNWDVSNVTSFYSTFYCCYKLEGLDLSKWDTRNVTYFNDNMLSGASRDATNKIVYYGDNSTNIYDTYKDSSLSVTLTYKANENSGE